MRTTLLVPLLLALAAASAGAADWYVPDDFPTIQSAVNLAAGGDTIHVRPGIYRENVVFSGLVNLTLESTDGPAATWIDGMRSGSVLTLNSGTQSGSLIRGFTITNGEATYGGGILCYAGPYRVEDCWIVANVAERGGGFYASFATPAIWNCLVAGNVATYAGGGVFCNRGSAVMDFVTIAANDSTNSGGVDASHSTVTLTNSIVWGNAISLGSYYGTFIVTYSDIEGGWSGVGNKDADPRLSGPGGREFYLRQDPAEPGVSNPCVDAGSDFAGNLGMDTLWTRSDGVADSSLVDMGYHYGGPITNPADTLLVPATYPTIQSAITAAHAGDTVLVSPGRYQETLYFLGKPITLKSSAGPASTIIDGGGSYTAVSFTATTPATHYSILEGFTITGGSNTDGGGIYIDQGAPQIRGNVIAGNRASRYGGGLFATTGCARPAIQDNLILANVATQGGGIYTSNCRSRILNDVIAGNVATYAGGGVFCNGGSAVMDFVTIAANDSTNSGGVDANQSTVTLTNSIVWGNAISLGSYYGTFIVTYSDIEGGWPGQGNIKLPPLLADPAGKDFHLQQDPCQAGVANPCVDRGSDRAENLDVGGLWTRTDGVADSGLADLGFHYPEETGFPGETLRVPADYSTIQEAIGAASFGDTVLVSPGRYQETLYFLGKPITLKSSAGPASTIIDGGGSYTTVSFTATNPATYYSILKGFTITGGSNTDGGGVHIDQGAPQIRGNVIAGNTASRYGGGLFATTGCARPAIQDNLILANVAAFGGGIYTWACRSRILNDVIAGNVAADAGGGVFCNGGSAVMDFVTIAANDSTNSGGVDANQSTVTLTNSIVWGNAISLGSYYGTFIVTYSDIEGGWPGVGNIDLDPLFTWAPWMRNRDSLVRTYHLGPSSPCIDAGLEPPRGNPYTDIDGDPRVIGPRPDMGCDEVGFRRTVPLR